MFARKRALERIANEKVLYQRRAGGDLPVCVVYPNIYRLGMANLGFPGDLPDFRLGAASCRRARLLCPIPTSASDSSASRNSSRWKMAARSPISRILAFSISFETDYLNVLTILRMAGIPLRRAERVGRNYPLIIAGGSAVFLNPEPIADFIDLFLIGEGEEMVPEFLDLYGQERTRDRPIAAARRSNWPVSRAPILPDYFDPELTIGPARRSIATPGPGEPRVKRRLIHDLDRFSPPRR